MADLKIQRFNYELRVPQQAYYIIWQAVEYYSQPNKTQIIQIGATQDLGASPFPQFTTLANAFTYYDTSKCTELVNYINSDFIGMTYFTSYTMDIIVPPVAASINFLQDAIDTINASKADKSTTVNAHALSSNVTVTKSDLSLDQLDNTSDANKPVSTATQSALNAKQNSITTGSSSQFLKGDLSLGTIPVKQSALADATGGATNNLATNYNLVSGILGVANGLNSSNTAQNDMANILEALVISHNSILAKLRTYGVINT